MDLELQRKIRENPKMYRYLKENSFYIKHLNRDPSFYNEFVKRMKELYHDRVSDKIGDALDNLDLISHVLSNLK